MDMSNDKSIFLQVDESTQAALEEVQREISSSIEDSIEGSMGPIQRNLTDALLKSVEQKLKDTTLTKEDLNGISRHLSNIATILAPYDNKSIQDTYKKVSSDNLNTITKKLDNLNESDNSIRQICSKHKDESIPFLKQISNDIKELKNSIPQISAKLSDIDSYCNNLKGELENQKKNINELLELLCDIRIQNAPFWKRKKVGIFLKEKYKLNK